jgi:hypothetical protein
LSLYQTISDASFIVPSDFKARWSVTVGNTQIRSPPMIKVVHTVWTASKHHDMQLEMWKSWQSIFTDSRQASKDLRRLRYCTELNVGWINLWWKQFDLLKIVVDIVSSCRPRNNYWGDIWVQAIQSHAQWTDLLEWRYAWHPWWISWIFWTHKLPAIAAET